MPRVKAYLKKHHLAVIGILVAILVVPWGVVLTRQSEDRKAAAEKAAQEKVLKATTTYYFAPKMSNVDVKAIQDGAECWGSASSSRSDAYRCSQGHKIYDPCFYQWDWNYVDCPSRPGEHRIITVKKIEKNPVATSKVEKPIPWYLTLENGAKCRFLTGATNVVADGRIDYGCDNKAWLSLPINNEQSVFTIKCYSQTNDRIEECKVKDVWY